MTSRIAPVFFINKTWTLTKKTLFFSVLAHFGVEIKRPVCEIYLLRDRAHKGTWVLHKNKAICGRNEPRRASPLQAAPSTNFNATVRDKK